MKFLVVLVALLSVIYSALGAMTGCGICCHIIGHAERHFRQNTPEHQLLHELTRECLRLGHMNQQDGQICLQQVHKNIDTIYKDFKAGKTVLQVCVDAGDCTASDTCTRPTFTTMPPF